MFAMFGIGPFELALVFVLFCVVIGIPAVAVVAIIVAVQFNRREPQSNTESNSNRAELKRDDRTV